MNRRKNAGRRIEIVGARTRSYTVTLDERSIVLLRVLGDGNLSRGIRTAARVAYERYQRS